MQRPAILSFLMCISQFAYSEAFLVPEDRVLKELVCQDNGYLLSNQSIGLRTVICALKNTVNIQKIEESIGEPLFQKNKKANPFDFNSANSFNHYRPAAIKKIDELYSMPEIKARMDSAYWGYFKNIARHHYSIALSLKHNPVFNQKYLVLYKEAISRNKPIDLATFMNCKNLATFFPENERYFKGSYYMQSMHNSNVAFFWFRRQIDGSFETLFNLLEKVVKNNDEKYINLLKSIKGAETSECETVSVCPL